MVFISLFLILCYLIYKCSVAVLGEEQSLLPTELNKIRKITKNNLLQAIPDLSIKFFFGLKLDFRFSVQLNSNQHSKLHLVSVLMGIKTI